MTVLTYEPLPRKRNVLISIPGKIATAVYLPATWGLFKGYCEASPVVRESFHWLDPIILKRSAEAMLEPYGDAPIDVLGLSCYCWNSASNYELARLVKSRYPGCLVIAGGPDPDYNSPGFFAQHPFLDAVALQDGEPVMRRLLEQIAAGSLDLRSIPNLILPPGYGEAQGGGPEAAFLRTVEDQPFQDFDYLPWSGHPEYYDRILHELRGPGGNREFILSWETDRGCPFRCTFCDWGSATNSKIRQISIERLREEAEWMGRNRIDNVALVSANFGVLPRDVEVIQILIDAKQKWGFPKRAWWNNAKNNVERVIEIHRRAFAAGLIEFHTLSIQTLDQDVLNAMRRSNISTEKQLKILTALRETGVPSVVQMIYGSPDDNPEKWQRSLTGIMEWGAHDEVITYPFLILPNAPANDPAYREEWGIRTIDRYGAVNRRDKLAPLRDGSDRHSMIVETNSFDRSEYVEMYVFGRLMVALHNSGLTQMVARYLRQTHRVPYFDFYVGLYRELCEDPATLLGSAYLKCREHIRRFVAEDGTARLEQIELEEIPEYPALLNIEEYLMFRFLIETERFYAELAAHIRRRYPQVDLLESLLSFQHGVMITPDYDRRRGRTIELQHDWPAYFADGNLLADHLPPPSRFWPAVPLHIDRRHSGVFSDFSLDWHESEGDVRIRWLNAVVGSEYARVQRSFFKDVSFSSSVPGFAPPEEPQAISAGG